MLSFYVFMAWLALVCPLSSAQASWQGVFSNNPITEYDTGSTIEGYGSHPMSSYVNGYNSFDSMLVYFDHEPPAGYGGFYALGLLSYFGGSDLREYYGDSRTISGLITVSHINSLFNSDGKRVLFLHSYIENPDELRILLGWSTITDCTIGYNLETWLPASTLLYTAPDGFVIHTVSTTVFNDMKYVAISLKSGDEAGPTILMYSYDMITFTTIGNITDETNTPIEAWKAFTIFSAANIEKPGEEALYIYHIESANSKSYLRYASVANAAIGRFKDVSDQFGFNDNDIMLMNQGGTSSAVSVNGDKVLLVRLGQEICTKDGTQTMVEKVFFPTLVTASPENESKVTDKNGNVRQVDAKVMPAITSTRCTKGLHPNPGVALPGWQVGLTWIDRSSLMLMQGFANVF